MAKRTLQQEIEAEISCEFRPRVSKGMGYTIALGPSTAPLTPVLVAIRRVFAKRAKRKGRK